MTKQETVKEAPTPSIGIIAQYIKDLSFEAPGTVPTSHNATPNLQINMHVSTAASEKNTHMVLLETKASAMQGKNTLFVLELTYAGVFSLENVPEKMLPLVLYIECPRILFPFVRSIVAHITGDGGFPPLYLAPVDFMAMYEKHQASNSIH
ncbi:MAG: protein-export chaperone SecB [Holosporales bacterium]|jgi:preprotein translocase subunit SecB|nr:protein-export chaperone SecB [Holosporales bacterium]